MNMKTKMLIFLVVMSVSFFSTTFVGAQEIDKRLWGVWDLDSVELTINRVTQKYPLPVLMADKSRLPRNMFTQLYFFSDQIGVNSTETEFVPVENVTLKGSFTTNNGSLVITLRGEPPLIFTYSIEGNRLDIRYTVGEIQFYLIFKLTSKLPE